MGIALAGAAGASNRRSRLGRCGRCLSHRHRLGRSAVLEPAGIALAASEPPARSWRCSAEAVAAMPKPSTVAVVVPIKRLNVMDAFSTSRNASSTTISIRGHPKLPATPNGLL